VLGHAFTSETVYTRVSSVAVIAKVEVLEFNDFTSYAIGRNSATRGC